MIETYGLESFQMKALPLIMIPLLFIQSLTIVDQPALLVSKLSLEKWANSRDFQSVLTANRPLQQP